jgi:hypothetical protein
MPLIAKFVGGKARVVEKNSGEIARHKDGSPVDGGGFDSLNKARKQATAINLSNIQRGK